MKIKRTDDDGSGLPIELQGTFQLTLDGHELVSIWTCLMDSEGGNMQRMDPNRLHSIIETMVGEVTLENARGRLRNGRID